MSETLNCPFDDPLKYSYTTNEIEISGGKAKLKLQQADIDFTEDFEDDTGHTYDSNKSEFVSGKNQQKDQKQTGATFGATYTNNINGNWGDGVLTGTAVGGASVSGGKLDLTGGGVKYVDYDANLNADSQQIGCVRLKYTPNYTGFPPTDYPVFSILKANGSTNNIIMLRHETGGVWKIFIEDFTGSNIMSASLPSWSATSGIEVELELNWDLTTGATRFFINGIQWGTTQTDTGTRDENITVLRIGSNYNGVQVINAYIDDVLIFPTVQHTTNYTPGYLVSDYIYVETSDVLPEMEHTGDGTIKLFNSLSMTYTGSPRVLLEIGRSGNKLYWNGSAWVTSDETYAQSTDLTTYNANCTTLPVDGEKYGQFTVVYPNSNTQSSVSELTANMNVDIGYLQTNPYGKILTGFRTDELEGFIETATKNGSDEIKYILENDGDYYYWNGSAWTTGNLIYSNSATASEIHANKSSLVSAASLWYVYWFLHSNDGTSTPELDNLQILYSFGGEEQETRNTCIIWADSFDNCNDASENQIDVYLNVLQTKYKTRTIIMREHKIVTPDANGYWEVELIENENMEIGAKYIFAFSNGDIFERSVPNESQKNFYDLEA